MNVTGAWKNVGRGVFTSRWNIPKRTEELLVFHSCAEETYISSAGNKRRMGFEELQSQSAFNWLYCEMRTYEVVLTNQFFKDVFQLKYMTALADTQNSRAIS